MRFDNPVASSSSIALLPTAWSARPSAVGNLNRILPVTDVGIGAVSYWTSNGSIWRPMNGGGIVLAELNSDVIINGTSEVVVFQSAIAVGLLLDGAILRMSYDASKSGTAESLTIRMRVGNAGTTADTLVKTSTAILQTTSGAGATYHEIIRVSATSVLPRGANNIGNVASMTGITSAVVTPVTISNLDAGTSYFSMCALSNGSSDVMTIKRGARIELVSVGA